MIVNPDGTVDRLCAEQRTANRAQRRMLAAMYSTCAHPHCEVPFTACRIHHIVWWTNGGRTVLDNSLVVIGSEPQLYVAWNQQPRSGGHVVVRTSGDPMLQFMGIVMASSGAFAAMVIFWTTPDRAISLRARALGMWQFISSTGYRYGLSRDRFVDERMDPEKATRAAIQYLLDLHGLFGDWMTALAAYNCGEARVLRVIKSQKLNYLDHFWDLYQRLPRETARYVPRFLATLAILEDPAKYGIELPEVEPSRDYETLEISKSMRLADLEQLAGTGKGSFVALNPELRYKVTPETKYTLKVPVGSLEKVAGGIASVAKWQLPVDSFSVHVVRRGETLSTIAARYRTSTSRIVSANNLRNRNRIWPGQRLKIPGAGTVPVAASGTGSYVHRVVRGDSLWKIAKRYRTTIAQIKAWNQLTSDRLQQGQLLKIRPRATTASGRIYYVKKGDTLAKIAKKHGVGLNSLLKVNQMSRRDRIYPNQPITLPD